MSRDEGPGGLDLLEEAVGCLRQAPASLLLAYYAGSLPFVLGLLYFWADMSRSALATERCGAEALGLACLFCGMKTGQALFSQGLWRRLAGRTTAGPGVGDVLRLAASQAAVHATGLVGLPVAAVLSVPFGWVLAFYQGASALIDGTLPPAEGWRRSLRHAALRPGQNHLIVAVLTLLGLLVFVNLAVGVAALPGLAKALLGIETAFSRSPWALLNTTFLASVGGLTYLCVDPLAKAVYTLRAFYGEARTNGDDLRAALGRQEAARAGLRRGVAAGAVFLTVILAGHTVSGREQARAASATRGVSPRALDAAVIRVLGRPEFAWRMPRVGPEAHRSLLQGFADSALEALLTGLKTVGRWIGGVLSWLDGLLPKPEGVPRVGGLGWLLSAKGLLLVLLALAASALALFLFGRRGGPKDLIRRPSSPAPDLADEDLRPDALPPDAWLALGRELQARGESRLALRALFLAGLAHLAGQGLITAARHKSNRDYERELGRRGHVWPELMAAFGQNARVFEAVWYGCHEMGEEARERFGANQARILGHGTR